MKIDKNLAAEIEPFDTFWEAPEDVERGYSSFLTFYKHNYRRYLPKDKHVKCLVISCGTGYFVNFLNKEQYKDVMGIDSDERKIDYAEKKNLNCVNKNAFPFLEENLDRFDFIFVEQEVNHLTKKEIVTFLKLCYSRLNTNGILIIHSLNGANPITGSEALAQNFNHFNTLTEYSLKQVLHHVGFRGIKVFPLKLYVFFNNPLNYVGIILDTMLTALFRLSFLFYGKKNKIFTKKIGAVCHKQ